MAAAFTHQFVRDPSDLRDLVGAERESYLSEVVIHVVVVVQLYDQDQLPAGRHGGRASTISNSVVITGVRKTRQDWDGGIIIQYQSKFP